MALTKIEKSKATNRKRWEKEHTARLIGHGARTAGAVVGNGVPALKNATIGPVPVQVAVGLVAALADAYKRPSLGLMRAAFDVAEGAALGKLGVMAHNRTTPFF